jgi:hypothetical protein
MSVKYEVKQLIRLGDYNLYPGDIIDIDDYGKRNWSLLIRRGRVAVLDPRKPSTKPPSVAKVEEVVAPPLVGGALPDLNSMSKSELVGLLESFDFKETDVKGSGANGYVTKDDLKKAIVSLSNN